MKKVVKNGRAEFETAIDCDAELLERKIMLKQASHQWRYVRRDNCSALG